jgi:very-short-patch-repair endonuclease/transposase
MDYINYDWSEIQKYYNDGNFWKDVSEKYKISIKTIRKYKNLGLLKERNQLEQQKLVKSKRKTYKHSDETKNKLSIWRKKYIKENPDKIKWIGNKSIPSERFKEILTKNNIKFVEEFRPLEDRYFSIDIAFPDKKIGLEINGEQHYERDGKLKKYYQDRHDLIEASGWKLYEISHYLIFKSDFIDSILYEMKKNNLENVDYSFYIKDKKRVLCECGHKKAPCAKLCIDCYKKSLFRKDVCDCGNKKRYPSKVCILCFRKKNKKVSEKELKSDSLEKICKCGRSKYSKSKECIICFNSKDRIADRKVDRPPLDIILKDVEELGYTGTGKKYGVSDNSIRKWIKRYKKMLG